MSRIVGREMSRIVGREMSRIVGRIKSRWRYQSRATVPKTL